MKTSNKHPSASESREHVTLSLTLRTQMAKVALTETSAVVSLSGHGSVKRKGRERPS